MKRFFVICGTRPEVIKLAPVVRALQALPGSQVILVNTGQQLELTRQMLSFFGLASHHDLGLMLPNQRPEELFSRALSALGSLLQSERPDWVVVQGDTGTAAAGAMAAFLNHIPVAHVEAGLRTYNLQSPWPEEYYRRLITVGAALHFAPTESARANLLKESVAPEKILTTGNTGIDSLLWTRERLRVDESRGFAARWAALDFSRPFVLSTFHRREALGAPMLGVFEAVRELSASGEAQFVLPLHPNPRVREAAKAVFGEKAPGLHLVDPLDYEEFCWLMDRATLLLTDSGGVQEEAPALGKPVVVARDETERQEAVTAGASVIAGADKVGVLREVRRLLGDKDLLAKMSVPRDIFGDGRAGKRIADKLAE